MSLAWITLKKGGTDVSEIEFDVETDADREAVDSLIGDLGSIASVRVEEPRRAVPEILVITGIFFTIVSGINALLEIIKKLSDFAKKGKRVTIVIKGHPIIIGIAKPEEIVEIIEYYNESTSSKDEEEVKLNAQQKANCDMIFGRKKAAELIQAIESGEIPYNSISREFRRAYIERSKELEQMDFEFTRVET